MPQHEEDGQRKKVGDKDLGCVKIVTSTCAMEAVNKRKDRMGLNSDAIYGYAARKLYILLNLGNVRPIGIRL